MDDLFSDDHFDKNFERQTRHSVLSSFGVLILLGALVIYGLLPAASQIPTEPIVVFQTQATITEMNRESDSYVMVVTFTEEDEIVARSIKIDKEDFMVYKEGQIVMEEVRGNHCKLINQN